MLDYKISSEIVGLTLLWKIFSAFYFKFIRNYNANNLPHHRDYYNVWTFLSQGALRTLATNI